MILSQSQKFQLPLLQIKTNTQFTLMTLLRQCESNEEYKLSLKPEAGKNQKVLEIAEQREIFPKEVSLNLSRVQGQVLCFLAYVRPEKGFWVQISGASYHSST